MAWSISQLSNSKRNWEEETYQTTAAKWEPGYSWILYKSFWLFIYLVYDAHSVCFCIHLLPQNPMSRLGSKQPSVHLLGRTNQCGWSSSCCFVCRTQVNFKYSAFAGLKLKQCEGQMKQEEIIVCCNWYKLPKMLSTASNQNVFWQAAVCLWIFTL